MTLRSLALVSAQRAKNTGSQQEKNIGTEKTRLAAGKKRPAAEKSCFRSGEKRQQKIPLRSGKNSKQQEKTPCSSKKALLQQKKCILEAAGKNRPRREKTRPRQEKNRPRQEKNPQQRKSSFATQKVAATEKIHFRNGKKQQPLRAVEGTSRKYKSLRENVQCRSPKKTKRNKWSTGRSSTKRT